MTGTAASDEVRSLAAEENLGSPLAVFRPAERYGLLGGWLLVGLFPFIFFLGTTPLASLVPGVVAWPLAVRGLLRSPVLVRKLTRRRIHLYEQGFVYEDTSGGLEVFRWDRITLFQRVRTRQYGTWKRRWYRLVVIRDDGETIRLTHVWAGMERLAHEVGPRATQAQLRVAQAALREGRSVDFGELSVNAHGVTGRRGSAPWSEIDVVTSRWARVTVLAADRFLPLHSAPAWKIPNVGLFLQLSRDQRAQGG